jgi:hypothetical protein
MDLPSTRNMKFFGWGKSWNQFVTPVCASVLALPTVCPYTAAPMIVGFVPGPLDQG